MRVADKAIILQSIRHGDNKHILKLYTKHNGLITAVATVGRSASSKVKPGSILPLNLVDLQLILKQNKEIHQLTEASCYAVHTEISGSLSRLSIAQFLNEVLVRTLKEQAPNTHLFEFIETCFRFLNDSESGYGNLHLYFLAELTKYLGHEPQNNYSFDNPFFDCREGRFTSLSLAMPLGLDRESSLLFSQFLKINALKEPISTGQRDVLLEALLAYYRLHVPGFNEVRSLEVLREVVSGGR